MSVARMRELRPATAPGEDRNEEGEAGLPAADLVLRPATAPGEDRNVVERIESGRSVDLLRPATAPGEDRNARAVSCAATAWL